MVAVEHKVIGAPHLGQTVGGKADCLIQRHANVQQDKGDDQRVDERCSQCHERVCVDDVAVEAGAGLLVESLKFRIENRSTTFQANLRPTRLLAISASSSTCNALIAEVLVPMTLIRCSRFVPRSCGFENGSPG